MKAKFLILPLLYICCSINLNAQNWLWAKGTTGTVGDQAYTVSTDPSGNVFVVGYFQSSTITFGSITLANAGSGYNIFIAKYDPSGNVLWARRAGGVNYDYGTSICTDANGNAFITGMYRSTTITFGTTTLTNKAPNGGNVFIVKYDPLGNVLWAKNAGGKIRDMGRGVCTDSNGNVFVTGDFSSDTMFFGSTILTNPYSVLNEIFIAKYDANGNILWVKSALGPVWGTHASSAHTDAAGNVFLTGDFSSPTITLGSISLINNSSTASTDFFIAKYDANGNVLWAKGAGGINNDGGSSVSTDASGNAFVTGGFRSPSITFGSTTLSNNSTSAGYADLFVVKYDPSGNVLWTQHAGGTNEDQGYSISTDPGGSSFITGHFESPALAFGSTVLSPPPATCLFQCGPMFIVKYDPNGNVLCASALSSGGDNANGQPVNGVSIDNFGNAYIGGSFSANPFIIGSYSLPRTGQENVFVAKYSCDDFPASIFQVNPSCNGQCNGTATATAMGGTSPYTYSWSNGQTTQTATGLCAGSHTIVISDANSSTFSSIITITQPSALILSATATSFCTGSSGSATVSAFGGTPAYTYNWCNGQTTTSIFGLSAGNYSVTITDTKGCQSTTNTNVNSLPSPIPAINGLSSICIGYSLTLVATGGSTYLWNTGSTTQSISIAPTSNNSYSVTVTGANGCAADTFFTVTVNPLPLVTILGNLSICTGQVVTLTASGGGSYLWSTGATSNSISISPSSTTSYSIVVTDANGCTNSSMATATVTPTPIASISPNDTICSGSILLLNASGGANYSWNTGATTPAIQVNPNTTTTYSVIVSNGSCADTAYTSVSVIPNPSANVTSSATTPVTYGQNVTLSASGGETHHWDNGMDGDTIVVSPNETTIYCVTAIDSNNCIDTACVVVYFYDICASGVYIPNAFSPNNDGENDFLQLYYVDSMCVTSLHIIIYERFGGMVFESTDPAFTWDGAYKNNILNKIHEAGTEVFTYYLDAKLINGTTILKKGNITLAR